MWLDDPEAGNYCQLQIHDNLRGIAFGLNVVLDIFETICSKLGPVKEISLSGCNSKFLYTVQKYFGHCEQINEKEI